MAEVKQYIPISQLDETRTVNPTDVLIISQKENPTDQEYVSKKISIDKISENITVPAATTDKTGGFKLYADSVEQNGKPYYVNLNDKDEAYVKVPEADGKTITENNGKISVSKELKNLADDIDNLVKKNVANAVVESKDGKYIAGFEQKNGKIELSSVQYKDLTDISGLSVVNTFDNASTTTVPSTALTKSSIQAVDSKLNSLHKVAYSGDYNQLINKPKTTGFVDLTSDQSNINGVKTFQKCPCTATSPIGTNNQELVNVGYLKTYVSNLKQYSFTPLIDWGKRNEQLQNANGSLISWCSTINNDAYKVVYEDGRYAQYVIPLIQDFTDFKKLIIIPVEYSGGSPDIESRIIDAQIFDWMLSCGFIQGEHEPRIDSISQLNYRGYEQLFIPYNGSSLYPSQKENSEAHSTKRRLLTIYAAAYSHPILEIFGVKEEIQ